MDEILNLIESVSEGFPSYSERPSRRRVFNARSFRGSTGGFLLLRHFSGVVSHHRSHRVSQYIVSVETLSLTQHRSYS